MSYCPNCSTYIRQGWNVSEKSDGYGGSEVIYNYECKCGCDFEEVTTRNIEVNVIRNPNPDEIDYVGGDEDE